MTDDRATNPGDVRSVGKKGASAQIVAAEASLRRSTLARTKSIAYIGLSIALIAVCSWVTIPLGPVPFTLQMFAIPLMICVLAPRDAIAAIYGFVALGAIGVPVFSGMRGGIGVLLGPTGGFLIGYLIGVPLAVGVLSLACGRRHKGSAGSRGDAPLRPVSGLRFIIWGIIAGLIFTFVAYATGCIQYMIVGGVGLEGALATSVIPFIVPDIIKVVVAVFCAQSVRVATGRAQAVRARVQATTSSAKDA